LVCFGNYIAGEGDVKKKQRNFCTASLLDILIEDVFLTLKQLPIIADSLHLGNWDSFITFGQSR